MPDNTNPQGGLLAGVFDFVSREFDSFVANATGVQPTKKNQLPTRNTRKRRVVRPRQPTPEPVVQDEEDESSSGESSRSPSRSPTPPPSKRLLKRRPSITMPGSLFPRSPSLEPSSDRHVHFEPGILSPPTHVPPKARPVRHDEEVAPAHNPMNQRASSSLTAPSIKPAVQRFHLVEDGADSSTLLPSPSGSPSRASRSSPTPREREPSPLAHTSSSKGKARAVEPPDNGTERQVRGKERELLELREEQMRHEKRMEEGNNSVTERDTGVERNRDKERIKLLEQEILRLKEELSKRPANVYTISSSSFAPPPPPPPPPPPALRIPITATSPTSMFASVRAALKHAPTPIEAPINGPSTTKRPGQPTLGITPDLMEGFLREMKTVRLRKVSGPTTLPSTDASLRNGNSRAPPEFRPPAPVLRKTSSMLTMASSSSNVNRPEWAQIGDKRKRFEERITGLQDDARNPKRRSIISESSLDSLRNSIRSANNSFAANSSFSSLASTSRVGSQATSFPSHIRTLVQPPGSVTDAATPSLCSDNEREGEASPDDHMPSTPPIVPPLPLHQDLKDVYHIDDSRQPEPVDMLEDELELSVHIVPTKSPAPAAPVPNTAKGPQRVQTPGPRGKPRQINLYHAQDVFSKRPPVSPLPNPSPKKPPAPARRRRASTPQPPDHELLPPSDPEDENNVSDDEDPLSLSFSSPEPPRSMPVVKPLNLKSHRSQDRTSTHPYQRPTISDSRTASRIPQRSRVVGTTTNKSTDRHQQQPQQQHHPDRDSRSASVTSSHPSSSTHHHRHRLPQPQSPTRSPSRRTSLPASSSQRVPAESTLASTSMTSLSASTSSSGPQRRRLTLDEEIREAAARRRRSTLAARALRGEAWADDGDGGGGGRSRSRVSANSEDVEGENGFLEVDGDGDNDHNAKEEWEWHDEVEGNEGESGTLVGMGTRSKTRGFLARGGGGGSPVFLGVGYVEGAEGYHSDEAEVTVDGGEDEERDHERRGRRSTGKGKGKGKSQEVLRAEAQDDGEDSDNVVPYRPKPLRRQSTRSESSLSRRPPGRRRAVDS